MMLGKTESENIASHLLESGVKGKQITNVEVISHFVCQWGFTEDSRIRKLHIKFVNKNVITY